MKKEIFIHIGYPKTGTTTLQKNFFPNIDEISYLGKFDNEKDLFYFEYAIINDLIFGKNTDVKESYKSAEVKIDTFMQKEKLLLSEESFLSNSLRVSRGAGENSVPKPIDVARNLRVFFDAEKYDVKIVMTIRKQHEMVTSLYAQSYTHFYSKCREYDSFEKFSDLFLRKHLNHPFFSALNYKCVVDVYASIFGMHNVYVLAYEELNIDPQGYIKRLCKIFNVDFEKYKQYTNLSIENKRSTAIGYKKTRKMSLYNKIKNIESKYFTGFDVKFSPKVAKFLDSILISNNRVDKTIFLCESKIQKIMSNYGDENKILSQEMGLDLERYGYFD